MSSSRQAGLRQVLPISILIVLIILCLIALWNLAAHMGYADFTAYWSASYLLRQGQNAYDPEAIMNIEQTLAHSQADFIMMAWNPPTLFVILLPLTWMSFDDAHAVWFITNVGMLLAMSLTLTYLYLPRGVKSLVSMCMLTVLFPPVLVALMMGQVTLLVPLGLLISMLLIEKERWFWSGFILILTTIKPHIAFLTVPYLLLYMAYRHRWQGWLGLLVSGGLCITILFVLRPAWMTDFVALLSIAPVNWGTPTIGGILSFLNITEVGRYLVVALLPLAWLLARSQSTVQLESALALLTAITVPTTFYGWSYDQSILLIPMAHLLGWLIQSPSHLTKGVVIFGMLVLFALTWIQRVISTDEMYYFWLPVCFAGIYCALFMTHRATFSIRTGVVHTQ